MAKSNGYFPNVVANLSTAKITDISQSEDKENYFAKVSYLTGKDQWQHCSFLVGSSLHKLAKRVIEGEQGLDDINPCSMEVHNLHFSTAANEGSPDKPYLNNKGVINKISKAVF